MTDSADRERQDIQWSAQTHAGRFRSDNEDAFLALAINAEGVRRLGKHGKADLAKNDYIFAVSDGMGGANAGEFASQIAVEKITQLFPDTFRSTTVDDLQESQDLLDDLFSKIHHELSHMGQAYKELEGMGATLSLCWVRPEWIYFAHVGDSRIYHLPTSGGIDQISHDHTNVGWQQRAGELSEIQARSHPSRNALQQVLGGKTQNLKPQLGASRYERGDTFLICSDGLNEGLWNSGINRIIRASYPNDFCEVATSLVEESVQTDGQDNTTAVVFQIF
jgi:protein phosphatase